jgi:hypothetical protein
MRRANATKYVQIRRHSAKVSVRKATLCVDAEPDAIRWYGKDASSDCLRACIGKPGIAPLRCRTVPDGAVMNFCTTIKAAREAGR